MRLNQSPSESSPPRITSRAQFHSLINTNNTSSNMAVHRNTRSSRNGMPILSMIKYGTLLAAIVLFTYMWSIYLEMSSDPHANLSVVAKDSLGMAPPKEERRIRGATKEVETKVTSSVASVENESADQTVETATQLQIAMSDTQQKQNRLYCMIPFIWTPSAFPAYHAIRSTWGKRCHITKFFIDPIIGDNTVGFYNMTNPAEVQKAQSQANLTLPNDVVILHSMQRPWHTCSAEENQQSNKPIGNCRNIWEKIWRGWVYTVYGSTGSHATPEMGVNENGKTDVYNAEWFAKVDADTYLFPDNLPRYVESKGWDYNDQHYFGHVLNHRMSDRKVSIVAGAAVFFSRGTLLKAAETFSTMSMERGDEEDDGTCRDAYTGTEEVTTAVCIKDFVKAEPAVDDVGREQISLYEVELILEYNRTQQGEWWFWEGKKKVPCHDNPNDCLAHLPLAFHHLKNADDLVAMENEFYSDDTAGRKENKGYVNEYFDKIRAAMRAAEAAEAQNAKERPSDNSAINSHDDEPVIETEHQLLQLQTGQSSSNRLYCMVPFIWSPKFQPQYEAIRKTWGQRCDVLKFYIDPIIGDKENGIDVRVNETAKASLPEDVVVVENIKRPWNGCGNDTCRNIWEKLWRSWILMDETGELDKAEWFTKVDADTYLFADNLKRYVAEKNWLPSEHHYFGHVLMHRIAKHDADASIVAGAAVFFSKATLKSLAEILKGFKDGEMRIGEQECKDAYTSEEEVVTAVCLKQNFGVEAQAALDTVGKELIAVAEPEDSLVWNRTEQGEWWYWVNKPKIDPDTGVELHQCCSDHPIAFHGYKDPNWFYYLENQFYDAHIPVDENKRWMYNWRNPDETKPYFERVKKALST